MANSVKRSDLRDPSFIAVVPCGPNDLARFCLLWASILETPNPFSEIWIVAPIDTLTRVQRIVGHGDGRVRWMEDQALFPFVFRSGPFPRGLKPGYRIQMLVKLWVAAERPGTICVTLDTDVLLWRRLAVEHIRSDEGLPWVFVERPSKHPEWYESAARILRLPELSCSHWVTPSPLDHRIAEPLLHHLRERLGRLWLWRLLYSRRPWTEYSLYHTFANHLEGQEGRALQSPGKWEDWMGPVLYERTQWPEVQAALSEEGSAPFALINSTSGIDPSEIVSGLRQLRPQWAVRNDELLARAGV